MLSYLTKHRFSLIDAVGIGILVCLIRADAWLFAAAWAIIGSGLSLGAEALVAKRRADAPQDRAA